MNSSKLGRKKELNLNEIRIRIVIFTFSVMAAGIILEYLPPIVPSILVRVISSLLAIIFIGGLSSYFSQYRAENERLKNQDDNEQAH